MAQRVIEENVVRGNQAGRIVERDDGSKVFLVGNTRGEVGPSSSDGGGDGGGDSRDNFAAQQRAASEALLRQQREREEAEFRAAEQRSNQSIAEFRAAVEGLEKPEDISGRIEGELGIPGIRESTKGLRQSIASAEGRLGELPGAVRESLRGGLVTEGQRQRLIAKESVPITKELEVLSRTLGVESANLSEAMASAITKTQFAIQGQERELEPSRLNIQAVANLNQQRLQLFADSAAREISLFTTQRESELNLLLDKLQNDRTLADQEFQKALQLAKSASDFENTKEQLILQSRLNREETAAEQRLLGAREIALTTLEGITPSTAGERGLANIQQFTQGVLQVFDQNRGSDGFISPEAYRQERARLLAKGVTGDDFDEQFSSNLSPEQRISLGVGSTTNVGKLGGDSGTGDLSFDDL